MTNFLAELYKIYDSWNMGIKVAFMTFIVFIYLILMIIVIIKICKEKE